MDINFRQSFINYTKDGVLDKQELQALKQKAEEVKLADPGSEDAQFAEQVIDGLGKVDHSTTLTYTLPKEGSSGESFDLEFDFTPTYSEKEKVPGDTMREAISNISQADTLKETKSDKDRCGAATLVNIALRSLADKSPDKSPGEVFAAFAKKFGIPSAFTYENVHKAQDKLYKYANIDGERGLSAKPYYGYDLKTGNITDTKTKGEIKRLADYLGLKTDTLIGPNKDNLDDKQTAIDSFFEKNPKGSMIVGVHLSDDGNITVSDADNPQNHFVEVYKSGNGFYMKDTGAVSNGNSPGYDIKFEGETIKNDLLYKNPGTTIGVTRP